MVLPDMVASKPASRSVTPATTRSPRELLAKETWIAEAVKVLCEAGLDALAVEPLSLRLGVTKGSFYWHFKNRDDLLRAVIETWEREATEGVIAELEREADPMQRLRQLFTLSLSNITHLRAEAALRAGARAGDTGMSASVHRVMTRRLSYVQSLYAAMGETPAEAKRMAVVMFGAYLGAVELASLGLLLNEEGRMSRAQLATYERLLMPASRSPR
jgi:AcrR family transcriptional regulator